MSLEPHLVQINIAFLSLDFFTRLKPNLIGAEQHLERIP